MKTLPDSSQAAPESPLPLRLWWLACILVVGSIAVGLYMTGGPHWQRILRLDEQRSGALSTLEQQVATYVQRHQALPLDLETLLKGGDLPEHRLKDPVTGTPYRYQKLSDTSFQLCATFQADTRSEAGQARSIPVYDPNQVTFYKHPAGQYCFVRKQLPGASEGGPWPERNSVLFGPAEGL